MSRKGRYREARRQAGYALGRGKAHEAAYERYQSAWDVLKEQAEQKAGIMQEQLGGLARKDQSLAALMGGTVVDPRLGGTDISSLIRKGPIKAGTEVAAPWEALGTANIRRIIGSKATEAAGNIPITAEQLKNLQQTARLSERLKGMEQAGVQAGAYGMREAEKAEEDYATAQRNWNYYVRTKGKHMKQQAKWKKVAAIAGTVLGSLVSGGVLGSVIGPAAAAAIGGIGSVTPLGVGIGAGLGAIGGGIAGGPKGALLGAAGAAMPGLTQMIGPAIGGLLGPSIQAATQSTITNPALLQAAGAGYIPAAAAPSMIPWLNAAGMPIFSGMQDWMTFQRQLKGMGA